MNTFNRPGYFFLPNSMCNSFQEKINPMQQEMELMRQEYGLCVSCHSRADDSTFLEIPGFRQL
jgi:hypothetical protein